MRRQEDLRRAVSFRREAAVCANAALATAIAEVKRAYLELEQGWLSLAPKVELDGDDSDDATVVPNGESNPPPTTNERRR